MRNILISLKHVSLTTYLLKAIVIFYILDVVFQVIERENPDKLIGNLPDVPKELLVFVSLLPRSRAGW